MLFCSVIAQNFLSHARVLALSLAEHHPGCTVDILIVDAPDAGAAAGEPFRRVSLCELPLPPEEVNRRRTLYDIAALASSLRGALLERCLARADGPVCYLDVDMLVLAPLDDIAPLAERHGIVLTPHATVPLPFRPGGFGAEQGFLQSGIFNGGFIALSRRAGDFLKWRDERVARDCVVAFDRYLLLGQNWLSLVPALFDHHVLRDRGVNLMGHGLGADDLTWRDGKPWIGETPVRLFHFGGGFDPHAAELWHSTAPPQWWPRIADRPGLARLCKIYAERLLQAGFDARPQARDALDSATRRFYREALLAADAGDAAEPPNPYTDGEAAFSVWLATSSRPEMEIPQEEIAGWYAQGHFTTDYTSPNFPLWMELLAPLREQPLDVLEIGSWEGRSALFFLNYLPRSRLVCIDPFTGNAIHRNDPSLADHLPRLESIFDANVAGFGDRVEKLVLPSADALPRLAIDNRQFRLAYVDGSHVATDVLRDAMLLWPMIVSGGIVIFDDYGLAIDPNEQQRPKVGIDAFLARLAGQYLMVHVGWQLIVRKI